MMTTGRSLARTTAPDTLPRSEALSWPRRRDPTTSSTASLLSASLLGRSIENAALNADPRKLACEIRCQPPIIGALLAAVAGALASGYVLPEPGVPSENPPGVAQALWPVPGTLVALAAAYVWGARVEPERRG
jgi:hypothetical protein